MYLFACDLDLGAGLHVLYWWYLAVPIGSSSPWLSTAAGDVH